MALDGRQTTNKYTTTNQTQAATTERMIEGRRNEQDMRGKRDTIVLGAL